MKKFVKFEFSIYGPDGNLQTSCLLSCSVLVVLRVVSKYVYCTLAVVVMYRGGMVQTNEQYEFVHYAVSVFDERRFVTSSPVTFPSVYPSPSSSSSSTPTHDDDDFCDLK